jgi:hypothetical protein
MQKKKIHAEKQKKHSVLEKHSQTEHLQGPWDSNISMFTVFKTQFKIFVFEMTMTSPKHAVFSQIRLSVPDTMDKEKYYHVKHYCTYISPRKNHLMQKTLML